MLDRELYKDTFSKLEASEGTLSEVMKMTTRRKRISYKAVLIAATVATLAIAFVGTAIAVNVFGLRDLIVPSTGPALTFEEFDGTEDEYRELHPDGTLGDIKGSDILSLSGFVDSPEYMAEIAWTEILRDYNSAGALWVITLDEIPEGYLEEYPDANIIVESEIDVPQKYLDYGAYNQHLVDRLYEVLDTYGLILNGEMAWSGGDVNVFYNIIANGSFIGDAIVANPVYVRESGTFRIDGSYGDIMVDIYSHRKGTFGNAFSMIPNIEEFTDEWIYTNLNGTGLLLSQSESQSIIIANTDTALTTIMVYSGPKYAWNDAQDLIDRNGLEQFADLIDFTQLK